MKKIFLAAVLILLTADNSSAQKEANVWYFGNNAGVDFNTGSPIAFSGSAMAQLEGCASISDTSGSALFYTDGASVWNRLNNQMPNGFGLLGDNNSAQAVIIVRAPGSYTSFYLFTTPTWGVGDMCYSIVDMTLQGGFGDVTTKNTPMFSNSTEKVTAVYHANGNDIWIIGHEWNTNNFYSFLLTNTGVNPVPVITSTGTVHSTTLGFAGYMKGSHNGLKLAYACTINMNLVELFDFDNSTGIPSNPVSFPNVTEAYGLEFSPDDSKLYATEENPATIIQWDLNAGSAAAIQASRMTIGNGTMACAALQLGPDGKIYLSKRSGSLFLGVINNPNDAGLACNFTDDVVPLTPGSSCQYGLPNFFQGMFSQSLQPVALFNAPNNICPGTCTNFSNASLNATSYLWTFSGANPSVSTDVNPTGICYSTPGQYDVQLIATNATGSDTLVLQNFINVYPFPPPQGIAMGGDTLYANQGAVSYQWYYNGVQIPGATNYFFVVTDAGNYNVVCTDANGCEVEAVIFDVPASLTDPEAGSMLVFPNPVDGKLFLSGVPVDGQLRVFSSLGQLLINQPVYSGSTSIDIKDFDPGIYFIEVALQRQTVYRKVIKH